MDTNRKIFFELFDCSPTNSSESFKNPNDCFEALIITALVLAVSTGVLLFFSLIQCFCTIKMKNKLANFNKHVNEILKNNKNSKAENITRNTTSYSSSSSSSTSESSDSESVDSSESEKPAKKTKTNQVKLKKITNNSEVRLPRYKVYKPNGQGIQEIVIQNEEQNAKTHKSRKVRDEDENSIDYYKNKKKAHQRSTSRGSRTSRGSHSGKKSKETRY